MKKFITMTIPLTIVLSLNVKTSAFGIVRQNIARHGKDASSSSLTCRYMASIQQVTKDGVYIVDGMPDPLPELKNTYYLLRHGQSEGNVEGVISSARSLATSEKHGLTKLGYEQGFDSAANLLEFIQSKSSSAKKVYFYSSPFARARQTAVACLDGIASKDENQAIVKDLALDIQKDIIIDDGLMERFFGDLDATPLPTYAYVWPEDQKDVTQTGRFNVESVAATATRLREVIMRIEESDLHKKEDGDIIVLTAHADVVQICQLYASGIDNVGDFSSYRFGNGEVRFVGRTPDTLPKREPLEMPEVMPEV